ncbi:hypothetical protein FPZ24_03070 [Sphingomonas panacisoli]|uniref:Uncharacterized protein n=2 Tax=Sphingomonas panacisoli TaxID=1813879 RepID=A0A5B8LHD6_9SPHN|nr:hypothetical protein FPZ24_03070 [Sphingomonas panacisoli]
MYMEQQQPGSATAAHAVVQPLGGHVSYKASVSATADEVQELASSGASAKRIEERLALLDFCATGRKSRGCGTLAQQIRLWFDSCEHARASSLSRGAIAQHITAAVLRCQDQRTALPV